MTDRIDASIKYDIQPGYLHCLVRWRSEIGTDEHGFEPAQPDKTLSGYPGSDGDTIVARIKAALIEPTLRNLRRAEPMLLTYVPDVKQFNKWMRSVEKAAGERRAHFGPNPTARQKAEAKSAWMKWESGHFNSTWEEQMDRDSDEAQDREAWKHSWLLPDYLEKLL